MRRSPLMKMGWGERENNLLISFFLIRCIIKAVATKIINILKDDRFEEILDIFKKSSAEEVIFVLPRKPQALADEADFEILAQAAQEHGRSVLILTSNPKVRDLAVKYDLGILTSDKSHNESSSGKPNIKQKLENNQESGGWTLTAFEKFEQEIV